MITSGDMNTKHFCIKVLEAQLRTSKYIDIEIVHDDRIEILVDLLDENQFNDSVINIIYLIIEKFIVKDLCDNIKECLYEAGFQDKLPDINFSEQSSQQIDKIY